MTKTTVVIWLKKSFDLHNKIKKMPKHRGELSLSSKYPPTDMLFEGIYHDKMIKFALPIQIDSVHSSDVPKTWASCFVDHGNHSRTVFENEQLGLIENCLECWVELSHLIQTCNCKSVNETEWLNRVCDAKKIPWLSYWTMFPIHTPIIEELVNHTFVHQRRTQQCQARRCCERLRFASCTSTRLGTNVCDPNTQNKPSNVDLESRTSPANEAYWKRPSLQSSIWISNMTEVPVIAGLIDATYQS